MSSSPAHVRRSFPRPTFALSAFVLAMAPGLPPSARPPVGSAAATDAQRLFDRGEYAGAITAASARLRAAPAETRTEIVLARAQAAVGRFDAAYGVLTHVLTREPRNPDALYYVAILGGVLAQ